MNYIKIFRIIWSNFESHRRLAFLKLLLLIILASVTEILSIGSLVPFVNIISSESNLQKMPGVTQLAKILGYVEYKQIIIFVTCIFLLLVVFGGLLRFWVLKLSSSLSFESGTVLSSKIYRNVLAQEYIIQIQRNSSELISNISIKSNSLIYGFLYPIVNIVQALVLTLLMLATLFYIDFTATLLLVFIISITYLFLYRIVNNQLNKNALVISREQSIIIQNLREGFGSIRDILLNRSFEYFVRRYYSSDSALRTAQGSNAFLSGFPKFIIETIGVLILGYLILSSLVTTGGISDIISIVVVIAFAAQRMLPTMQMLFHSLSSIKGNIHSVSESIEFLKIKSQIDVCPDAVYFNDNIQISEVTFRYPNSGKIILENVTIEINKGDVVGIIGETGSGKSTLVDIIASLLEAQEGDLKVDGLKINSHNSKSWMKNISYLSQSNYFLDASIAENIAFGIEENKIDHDLLEEAIDSAVLSEIIAKKGGLSYKIGENGCNLSGGQKQRLALARILYKRSPVIIIDEGTSALDRETEKRVFESLKRLEYKPTIIFVTHNLENLIHCNKVFEVKNSKVSLSKKLQGSFL